ncbi:DUF2752 domain-containing protein [Ferruginibacter yonginensis]|uniref:DUF2752 domain-containing protein n=1 Tax=Ferruginibacter yonginensis TaxID=1310416 RepID=A0ABV8QXX1_9BACT
MQTILLNITQWLTQHQLPCLVKSTIGVACPSCGLQRSAIALLQGQWWQSVQYYPALIPIIVWLLLVVVNQRWAVVQQQLLLKYGLLFIFSIIILSYIYKLTF